MSAEFEGANRRKFNRMLFSAQDDVFGIVSLQASDAQTYIFKIADIGAGGLRFIVQRTNLPAIGRGDRLHLRAVGGLTQLDFVGRLELEIRWLLDEPAFAHVVVGCQFTDISETLQRQIDEFVRLESRRR